MINFFPVGTVVRTYSGEWVYIGYVDHDREIITGCSIFGYERYAFDFVGVGINNNHILDVNTIQKYRKVWFGSLRTPKHLDRVEVDKTQGVVIDVRKSKRRARVAVGSITYWVDFKDIKILERAVGEIYEI